MCVILVAYKYYSDFHNPVQTVIVSLHLEKSVGYFSFTLEKHVDILMLVLYLYATVNNHRIYVLQESNT